MDNTPNCFYRISIKALVLNEEKRFLLSKEDNGFWELPGGGMEFKEKPQECLKREIMEEMGVQTTFIAEKPAYFLTAIGMSGIWVSNVIYLTRLKDLNFTPSRECVETKFFTKEEAGQKDIYRSVQEFIKLYDPNDH